MSANESVLTADQLAAYARDGFLVVGSRFDGERLAALRAEAEALAGRVGPLIPDNPRLQLDRAAAGVQIRKIEPLVDVSEPYAALSRDPWLLAAMRALLGDEPVLFEDKLNYKHPEGGSAFPMHQDYTYWQEFSPRLTSALIYLDEATEANGCLEVVPGRHRGGLLPSRPQSVGLVSDFVIAPEVLDPAATVKVPGPAGTVILFSGFTPHTSGVNRTTGFRRAVIFTYGPRGDGTVYEYGVADGAAARCRAWLAARGASPPG